jgi:ADP-ribose pyrophosphatase YjhB (NUDIX family)
MEKLKLPDRVEFPETIERNTFGCIAIVYCRSTGRVVMQHRIGRNGRVSFALPGGKKNEGERSRDCVVREIREETGLNVIDIYPYLYRYEFENEEPEEGKLDRRHLVIQYFLAIVDKESELANQLPDGKEFNPKWYSLNDVQTIADSFLLYNARGMKEAFRGIGFTIKLRTKKEA